MGELLDEGLSKLTDESDSVQRASGRIGDRGYTVVANSRRTRGHWL